MHRIGVSAPDIAGADESNLPAPKSFRSIVAYFESASGLIWPVPPGFATSTRAGGVCLLSVWRILGKAGWNSLEGLEKHI